MDITSEMTFDKFRIKFNGIIHMSINKKVDQMQSWTSDDKQYSIEIVTADSINTYEYDSREKWEKVIKEMEKHDII